MRNRKLYESVEKLVKQRKNQEKCKKTFAEDYCHEQLLKKKLIPRDNTSKIKQLMKNFKSIDTYINVDDLIECINQHHMKELKNHQNINETNQKVDSVNHRRYLSESTLGAAETLVKAKNTLKQYYKGLQKMDRAQVKHVVDLLEENSAHLGNKLNNRVQNAGLFQLEKRGVSYKIEQAECENIEWEEMAKDENKNINSPNIDKLKYGAKKNWNLYECAALKEWKQTHATTNQSSGAESRHNETKKRNKLFQLARIYLQMILEDEHKKKWNNNENLKNRIFKVEKNKTEASLPGRKNKNSNKISCENFLRMTNDYEDNETNFESLKKSSLCSSSKSIRPKFVRKNQEMKTIAIKKVNNFLMELDEDEILLRRQKKLDLCNLQKFQQRINEEASRDASRKNHIVIWDDEEKVNELQKVLKIQRK